MSAKPFFIGWEAEPPMETRSFLKRTIALIALISFVVAGVTAAFQSNITSGQFDFGNTQEFSGVFLKNPVPMLVADDPVEGEQILYLVAPLKFGIPRGTADRFHLKHVTLTGTFIGDDLDVMIELVNGGIAETGLTPSIALKETSIGETKILGEIVDSKCHLGVMNPGRFKPHRACAIRCIEGGIPPILVAQDASGTLAHYLLVGAEGEVINDAILDYVAEPVQATGVLKTMGTRKVLYVDPQLIDRL